VGAIAKSRTVHTRHFVWISKTNFGRNPTGSFADHLAESEPISMITRAPLVWSGKAAEAE
jgi:hypothetical protein